MDAGQRESLIKMKNRCTRSIFKCLEEKTNFLELDFEDHNLVRNTVRYEVTRVLNMFLKEMGEEEKVRMSRHADNWSRKTNIAVAGVVPEDGIDE